MPSYADNLSLVARYQAGDRAAAEELLAANSGLIASIARRYLPRAGSLEFDDLAQEAKLGFLHAVSRFDLGRGTQLSTFATLHIHRALQVAIRNTAPLIRLPAHIDDRARKAAATGEDQDWLAKLPRVSASLDAETTEDGSERLSDLIPAPVDIERDFVGREWTAYTLASLQPRERTIIQGRLGLGWHCRPQTLEQLAKRLQLTREGVRQIELRALRKIRERECATA